MDKMDASKQTFVVLAVQEYTQLKNKYDVHLKNIMEEERRRRRILMSSVLRSTRKLVMKTGTVGGTEMIPTSDSNMATGSVDIYLDSKMNMFEDPQKTTPFPGPLYQKEEDPTSYYLNEDLTVKINIIEDENLNTKSESCQENTEAAPGTSPLLEPVTANESFSKEQTLFLIDLMRQHIESKGNGLPKTLEELSARLKSARGTKKNLWKDAADKLGSHFLQVFSPDRVARKWHTLVDAFGKIKENNKTTGMGPVRFQFYSEMEALLERQHDVVISVGRTSPASSPVRVLVSESFSKDQTLFLIDFVRQHIESKGEGPPKSLEELIECLKSPKGTKKDLWKNAADKLSGHFTQSFCPDKVARKWFTLVEAYKKIKEKCKTASKGPIRFQFYSEMEALVGGQHDLVGPDGGISPLASPVKVLVSEIFTKDQTLFLIDFVRQHIESEGERLPKSLKELNTRLKSPNGTKKDLWKDAADKLASHFTQSFCPDRVARKWYTLVEAYKKTKDNNKTKGIGAIRFQFYSEMEALLAGQHDVVMPVGNTSPSTSPEPAQENDGLSKEQTLFLIDLMRQHIESKGEGLPGSLEELSARLKSARGTKKDLWKDAADKLASHFTQSFCPVKVARKWYTLQVAYRKIKESDKTRGKSPIRFQFFSEMDALLGGHHEFKFPAVGTSVGGGVEVRSPEALGGSSCFTEELLPTSTLSPPSKRQKLDFELMQFLQDSEEAGQRRHEETLAQLRSAQQGFEVLMKKLLDKL